MTQGGDRFKKDAADEKEGLNLSDTLEQKGANLLNFDKHGSRFPEDVCTFLFIVVL